MIRFILQAGRLVLTFIITLCVLLALLIGSALIPKENIHRHMLKSAEYMVERPTSYLVFNFALSSQIDYFADCITLSIADYLDEKHPLGSAMWAKYYGDNSNLVNEQLKESVQKNLAPNQEYIRYWHGSAAMIRFLHLFWNIKTIYFFHAVLLLALILALILILIAHGYKWEAVTFIFSMIVVSVWFVPMCLEYTYSFLCMLIAAIIGTWITFHQKTAWLKYFFLIVGMVTVFFDFLTTETLSLLVPLFLICRIRRRQNYSAGMWIDSIRYSIAWGVGYAGMWVMKWVIASIVLGIDVLPYVSGHISERIGGKVISYHLTGNMYTDALVKNLRCLFPFEYGIWGAALVLVFTFFFIVLPVASGRIRIRQNKDKSMIILYAALGMVPYLRYLVLNNHSFVHFFFTYRAQAATVFAICFIIMELVVPSFPIREVSNASYQVPSE